MATDFLVLGGGVAGLRAALDLAEEGRVLILNKGKGLEGSSQYAQGGVAVALGGQEDQKAHFRDTVGAGAGMCNEEAVRILVREGPRRIRELIDQGAKFDQKGGRFLYAKEAAHSRARVLRAKGDTTGEEIVRTLLYQAKRHARIRLLDHCFILDLIAGEDTCLGAVALDEQKGNWISVSAKATLLATGGAGRIYQRTTNPGVATGDGMAMAYRAGALLEDMEFVQFHPTALCADHAPAFLLTEALRGEGAILRNKKGEAFMKRYHPAKDLAPRDAVSRAIWAEIEADRLSHVDLDLTHLDGRYLKIRFPMIYKTCLAYGIDFTRRPIPVSPAAHFMIGGVKTDLDGATTLKGLYAVGEVASTQVHGANRLGSNSLLEGLVFGARAAKAAARFAARSGKGLKKYPVGHAVVFSDTPKWSDKQISKIQEEIQRIMWEKVGIVRAQKPLQEAILSLMRVHTMLAGCHPSRRTMETCNMSTVALMVATAALRRRGSVGVHFRSDFSKNPGKNWREHLTLSLRNRIPMDYGEPAPRYRAGASV